MSAIRLFDRLFGARTGCERCGAPTGADVVFECRYCGTTLDDGDATCPVCGHDDVARYDLR